MITITPHMRILVAVEPIDFRVGMDGLVNACKTRLQSDPFSGAVFVFGNRSRTALKLLVYDGQLRAKRTTRGAAEQAADNGTSDGTEHRADWTSERSSQGTKLSPSVNAGGDANSTC